MELQIPHSICAKAQEKSVLPRETGSSGEDIKTTMRMERSKYNTSRSMPRSCAYAGGDTAKDSSSKFHGVAERKKQPDAVREVPGAKI